MVELSEDILDKLRCSECGEYLSCEPVFLRNNSTSVCGRCEVPKDLKIARNKAYEDIASAVVFPCRYKKDGCSENKTIQNMKKHEEECKFHRYSCPILPVGTCSWGGNRSSLLEHFTESHPVNILDCTKLNQKLTENFDDNYLMTVFGFLFLVQLKCRTMFDTVWVNVRLLGNSALVDLFEYRVEVSNGVDQIVKNKNVQKYRKLPSLQVNNAIGFSLKNILNDLGDCSNVWFDVSINVKDENCHCCKEKLVAAPLFRTDYGYSCEKCISFQYKACKNQSKGCDYSDYELNLIKHEKWLCKYAWKACSKCRVSLKNTSLLEHDIEKHTNFRFSSNEMSLIELSENQQYKAVLTTEKCKFYCIWKIGKESLDFDVISTLDKVENRKFKCFLELENKDNNTMVMKEEIVIVEQNVYYFDWDLTMKEGQFSKAIGLNNNYALHFKIIESEEKNYQKN